jgi:hypothetical protein
MQPKTREVLLTVHAGFFRVFHYGRVFSYLFLLIRDFVCFANNKLVYLTTDIN